MNSRITLLNIITLLTLSLVSLNYAMAQQYDVQIRTGEKKAAVYSSNGFVKATPYIKNVNFDMVQELFVIGENDIFSSITGEDFLDSKQILIEPYHVLSNLGGKYDNIELDEVVIREYSLNPLLDDAFYYNAVHDLELLNKDLTNFAKSSEVFGGESDKKFTLTGLVEKDHEFRDGYYNAKHRATLTYVTWTLMDKITKSVLFEKKMPGGYYFGKNFKIENRAHYIEKSSYAYRQSVISSLVQFLKSNEMINRNYLTTNSAKITSSDILTLVNGNKFCSSLDNCRESTVTIQTKTGHGSGFFISSQGYLITNHHVISDDPNPKIILSNGISLPAKIVRTDEKIDVALLKVEANGFSAILTNNRDSIRVGEDIFAIGTPKDISLGQTISKGIVSAIRSGEPSMIQTDVSVNSGNSGGPLINEKSRVIGIVTSKLTGNGTEGIAFAIPIQDVLEGLNIQINTE